MSSVVFCIIGIKCIPGLFSCIISGTTYSIFSLVFGVRLVLHVLNLKEAGWSTNCPSDLPCVWFRFCMCLIWPLILLLGTLCPFLHVPRQTVKKSDWCRQKQKQLSWILHTVYQENISPENCSIRLFPILRFNGLRCPKSSSLCVFLIYSINAYYLFKIYY